MMPNHIHLLLTLQNGETETSFQRDFLKFTAQQLVKSLIRAADEKKLNDYKSTQHDRIYHIWERRPRWIPVRNLEIFKQKMDYIHHNPLQPQWALAGMPTDYDWSSAAYYENNNERFSFITPI